MLQKERVLVGNFLHISCFAFQERQRQMMEQLAAQRRRFLQGNNIASDVDMDASSSATSGDREGVGAASDGAARADASFATGASTASESASASTSEAPSRSSSHQRIEQKEYTCCLCLMHAPASEDKPMGLVALIQVSSLIS
jgi:hypothetical protein